MTKDKPKGWQNWVVYSVVGLPIGLVAVYFLSNGPVYWLFWKGYISGRTFRMLQDTLYVPFVWCHKHIPSIGSLIDQYLQMWQPF